MFEEIFFPKTAEKYRAGPLAGQRERYLRYLQELGASRSTLRKCANDQLSLIRLLDLQGDDQVSIHRIEAAAIIWSGLKGRRCKRPASSKARARFVSRGVQWLRFLGWLDEPERERHPHHVEVAIFEKWLREERGLSDATIQSYCHAADHFFVWLAAKGTPLVAVRIVDIDDSVAAEHKRGAWNRRTTHDYAQRLRAFFLHAETRSWCRTGLA
ncbi:MAG: site-specific integrase, partial [Stellaceae bacterium]